MTLLLAGLSACATQGTQKIADSACTAFNRIRYSVPPLQADGTRTVAVDTGNRYDTVETVSDVAEHNARFEAVCGELPEIMR